MSNGKVILVYLIAGLIKMILNEIPCMKISQYFPKPYYPFRGDINAKVYLSIYATKTDLTDQLTDLTDSR